jgi:hypothetical protein
MSATSLLPSNYIDPLSRISGTPRQIQSFIITMSRLAGNPIGGMENRYARYPLWSFSQVLMPIVDVGNG